MPCWFFCHPMWKKFSVQWISVGYALIWGRDGLNCWSVKGWLVSWPSFVLRPLIWAPQMFWSSLLYYNSLFRFVTLHRTQVVLATLCFPVGKEYPTLATVGPCPARISVSIIWNNYLSFKFFVVCGGCCFHGGQKAYLFLVSFLMTPKMWRHEFV